MRNSAKILKNKKTLRGLSFVTIEQRVCLRMLRWSVAFRRIYVLTRMYIISFSTCSIASYVMVQSEEWAQEYTPGRGSTQGKTRIPSTVVADRISIPRFRCENILARWWNIPSLNKIVSCNDLNQVPHLSFNHWNESTLRKGHPLNASQFFEQKLNRSVEQMSCKTDPPVGLPTSGTF